MIAKSHLIIHQELHQLKQTSKLNKQQAESTGIMLRTLHRCRQTGEQPEVHQSCRQSRSLASSMFHWKNEQAPPTQSEKMHTCFTNFNYDQLQVPDIMCNCAYSLFSSVTSEAKGKECDIPSQKHRHSTH